MQRKKSYFSTKTYGVGTQMNRLNETVLLSTQNLLKLMGKKIFTILRYFCFCLSKPVVGSAVAQW